ncbi:5877_t:CDS:1, partial [Racocetra fulgida]
ININEINLIHEIGHDFYENLDDFPTSNVNKIVTNFSTSSIKEIWETICYHATNKNYVIIFED